MAGQEGRLAEGVTELVAFGVDGVQVDGEVVGEQIKDGAGGHTLNEVRDRGDGGAEGNFLEDRITIRRWEDREGN